MLLKRIINETGMQKKPAIVFALIHIAVIATRPLWGYTDDSIYLWVSKAYFLMDAGQLPYVDFDVEYPPLGFLMMVFPRWLASTPAGYDWITVTEVIVMDLIGLLIMMALVKRIGISFRGTMTAYTLLLLVSLPVLPHWDFIHATTVLAALYAFIRNWNLAAWILLAIGAMFKFYPIIFVPLLGIYLLCNHEFSRLLRGCVAFLATVVLVIIPFLLMSPQGLWSSVTYHLERGLGVESTYGSYLLLGQELNICSPETCRIVYEHNSYSLDSPVADSLSSISGIFMLIALFAVYACFALKIHRARSCNLNIERNSILNFSILVLLVFLVTSKVFQHTYIIWIIMLIPLVTGQLRITIISVFIIAFLPGAIRVSLMDSVSDLIPPGTLEVSILVWRNTLLIVMIFLLFERDLLTHWFNRLRYYRR